VTEKPLIHVKDLVVSADGQTILSMPEWRLGAGEAALLLGPSGSGKTTLLHVIAGLIRPSAGTVTVAGVDVHALRPGQADRFRGRAIGFVFQTIRLIRALTVEQNLALALNLAGKPADKSRISATLDRLGVAELAAAKPPRLSVGEAQRCAIARAVVAQPRLILADEPTSALDDGNAERAFSLLRDEARACGAGLLIATHDGRLKALLLNRLELAAR